MQAEAADYPYFQRTFDSDETEEIRIYLQGGADSVRTLGDTSHGIKIRIIGGSGNNVVDDSAGFAIRLYGPAMNNTIVGSSGTKLKTKPFEAPSRPANNVVEGVPPRDWGSKMIPAGQAIRSLLALKLFGNARHSHVMSYVLDEGLALFAGLNSIPKRSFLTEYSCRIDPTTHQEVMKKWFDEVSKIDAAAEILMEVERLI